VRPLIVLGVIGVVLVVWLFVLEPGNPRLLDDYALEDADTLRVGTTTIDAGWTRVTEVTETESEVLIVVKLFTWPVPGGGPEERIEFVVDLDAPLGDRVVTDPFHEVLRADDN
jgi:hypothetical protein